MFKALWVHTLPLRALLAAALIGVSAAVLSFPHDGVDLQRSSRDVVREILDDWDKRAAELDLMRNRTGVSLLFSALSGNIEALVSGTSLPKHPEQGFFISLPQGDYRGVIWKSQPIASVDSREYLLEFQVEPLHGATLGIQVIDEVGSISWSADIASDGILNTTRFSASGERLRIELTTKTETGGLTARVLHLNLFGVL